MLDPGERCAVGKAGESPQTSLIVGEEQFVAPRDRRLQRALSIGTAAGRVTQQGEPVVESSPDLVDRHRPRPGGRELDCEGEPVERATHGLDGRPGIVRHDERGSMRGRSLCEQQHRVGEGQWCEGVDRLAVESERQLAGAQHTNPRCSRDQVGDEVGDGVHDLLAIVEDEQQV